MELLRSMGREFSIWDKYQEKNLLIFSAVVSHRTNLTAQTRYLAETSTAQSREDQINTYSACHCFKTKRKPRLWLFFSPSSRLVSPLTPSMTHRIEAHATSKWTWITAGFPQLQLMIDSTLKGWLHYEPFGKNVFIKKNYSLNLWVNICYHQLNSLRKFPIMLTACTRWISKMCFGANFWGFALQLLNEKSDDIWHKFDNKNAVSKNQTGQFDPDDATLVS